MIFRRIAKSFFFIFFLQLSVYPALAQDNKTKWEGKKPPFADSPEKWIGFLDYLKEKKLRFTSLAASYRMVLYFDDVESSKISYQTLVELIDLGYPNNLNHLFMVGNLELDDKDEFSQNYNFYKAVINKLKGMEKWSNDFFLKLDQETFKKYRFYQAMGLYSEKKYDESLKILEEILKSPLAIKDFTFAKKVARMMARIYFEQKKYEKSLQFYDEFLLKTNPVNPSDWIEKAWNLFYLKKYDDALGILFNLETDSLKYFKGFEKYIIRASIYLNMCATDNVKSLIDRFNTEYKTAIKNIINGKVLATSQDIAEVAQSSDPKYKEVNDSIKHLLTEYRSHKDSFPKEYREMAMFLYRTEIAMLRKYAGFFKEQAYAVAAQDLTMLSESLRFLEFGTAREKYNPAVVFMPRTDKDEDLIRMIDLADRGFIFDWKQNGTYWRDERNKYKGKIEDKCNI